MNATDIISDLGLSEAAPATNIQTALAACPSQSSGWYLSQALPVDFAEINDEDIADALDDAVLDAERHLHTDLVNALQADAEERMLLDGDGEPVSWSDSMPPEYGDPVRLELPLTASHGALQPAAVAKLNDCFGVTPAAGDDVTALELLNATGKRLEQLWHELCRDAGVDSVDCMHYPPQTMEDARGCLACLKPAEEDVKAAYISGFSQKLEELLPAMSVKEHNQLLSDGVTDGLDLRSFKREEDAREAGTLAAETYAERNR